MLNEAVLQRDYPLLWGILGAYVRLVLTGRIVLSYSTGSLDY